MHGNVNYHSNCKMQHINCCLTVAVLYRAIVSRTMLGAPVHQWQPDLPITENSNLLKSCDDDTDNKDHEQNVKLCYFVLVYSLFFYNTPVHVLQNIMHVVL